MLGLCVGVVCWGCRGRSARRCGVGESEPLHRRLVEQGKACLVAAGTAESTLTPKGCGPPCLPTVTPTRHCPDRARAS